MSKIDRRALIAAAGLALAAPELGNAQESGKAPGSEVPKPTPEAKGVTHTLARYVVNARFEALPETVRREATRTFLNWVGVAIGGSHHETLDVAVSALAPFSGPAQAGLFGGVLQVGGGHAVFVTAGVGEVEGAGKVVFEVLPLGDEFLVQGVELVGFGEAVLQPVPLGNRRLDEGGGGVGVVLEELEGPAVEGEVQAAV